MVWEIIIAAYILGIGIILCMGRSLANKVTAVNQKIANTEQMLVETIRQRDESGRTILLAIQQMLADGMQSASQAQKNQLDNIGMQITQLTSLSEMKLEHIRVAVEQKVQAMAEANERKLEQIRSMVDEKLHETLEKRLSESFKLVSERLEIVHRGLGEMQNLASGVGDLKRVLSNVKTRGVWGEVQLEAIITQIMTPAQYEKNVAVVPSTAERVEFAIRLPNKTPELQQIWLPIDAKCPLDDYHRLLEAQDSGNLELVVQAHKALVANIKKVAKSVNEKYVKPPFTTDFAIVFLPIEGMYAEVLRHPGLIETLQRECRVVLTSPTTLSAILSSLQMGFRTLAIEQRSSEVWKVLSSVKTEFIKFADILGKTKSKLDQASKVIGDVEVRSRAMQRHLREVEAVAEPTLGLEAILSADLALEVEEENPD